MSAALPAPDQPEGPRHISPLREVLAGEMGAKYGPLPVLQLPQDNVVILGFIIELVAVLKDKGIYRRGSVVVIPYGEDRNLMVMEAKTFCSWVLHYVMPAKTKYDDDGDPYSVYKDMPTEVAEKVLLSQDFWPELHRIDAVQPAPLPAIRDGELVLLEEGYDMPSRTYTFPLV